VVVGGAVDATKVQITIVSTPQGFTSATGETLIHLLIRSMRATKMCADFLPLITQKKGAPSRIHPILETCYFFDFTER
jgi:hypothetical protein